MATTATTKVIGLWLDETDDRDYPAWVVSRDRLNADGEAETSATVDVWDAAEDDARGAARRAAIDLGRREGLCVVEYGPRGEGACVYAPKIISICDGIGHYRAEYRLHGSTLEMVESGGCDDALNRNGCAVDDEMDDDAIIEAVRASWTGDGYDGDPDENGLAVHVVTETTVIAR